MHHQLLIQFIIKSLWLSLSLPYLCLSLVLADFHSSLGFSCFYLSLLNSLTCEIYLSLSLFLSGSPWLSLDFLGSSLDLFLILLVSTYLYLLFILFLFISDSLCFSYLFNFFFLILFFLPRCDN